MPKRGQDTLNVALLGGSVAVGTVSGVLSGGYRQPQPLMKLNYYYALGAEYDLIISLDGFNEIAIASSGYKWGKVHPSFPRSWNHRLANTMNPELIKLQAKKVVLEDSHSARARFMSNPINRNSPLSNLLWKILHSRFSSRVAKLNSDMTSLTSTDNKPREFQYETLGPEYSFQGWEELLEYSAEIWAKSNHLAHGVAQVQGAKFYHFIQPNQYIDGAKPLMSEQERKIAIIGANAGGGYGRWYEKGFQYVKKNHQWLLEQGVNSTDLTFLYKDIAGEIYIDNCCHVNTKGSHMIVKAIVAHIHQSNLSEAKRAASN